MCRIVTMYLNAEREISDFVVVVHIGRTLLRYIYKRMRYVQIRV